MRQRTDPGTTANNSLRRSREFQADRAQKESEKEARKANKGNKGKGKSKSKVTPAPTNESELEFDASISEGDKEEDEPEEDRTRQPEFVDNETTLDKRQVELLLQNEEWYDEVLDVAGALIMTFRNEDKNQDEWYRADTLKRGTALNNQIGLYEKYDDGSDEVHLQLDITTYMDKWYLVREDDDES